MKRNRFPYIISSILMMLIVGVSILGFFSYQNLNQIIHKLEREARPNLNLLLLNKVSAQLQEVEYAVESFIYSNDDQLFDEFNSKIATSISILDTLRTQNTHLPFLKSLDTLENLILDKRTVLNQVASLDYESMEETFATIKNQLNGFESKKILEDTILRKKRGFIQRLFGKKVQEIVTDTIDIYSSEEYKKLVDSQLDSIARQSRENAYTQKLKEFALQRDHQDIQGKITKILTRLDRYELNNIRSQAFEARNIA
ncbi:MAG: hypothetical protein AAFY41_17370, partial [Bacteroidota bacterium]